MPEVDDMELVREYADGNSESSFAELAQRHINLVYSVALRFTRDPADAQDVTQAVFIILARKAANLSPKTILTGWLYETTRFTAMKFLRSRFRQQAREQEAYMQSTLNDSNTDSAWKQLAPLLEEGMTRLNEKERTLLALRFFENKSGSETAAILGIHEWAAHKRVNRAVEKLRGYFTRRGVVLSAAALTAAITGNSVQAAPAGLAVTICTAKGAAVAASLTALVNGTIKTIFMTTIQKTLITATLVAGVGVGIYGTGQLLTPRSLVKNGDFENGLKGWIADTNKISLLINPKAKRHPGDGYAMIGGGNTQDAVLAQNIRLDGKGGNYRVTFDFGSIGVPGTAPVMEVSVANSVGDILASVTVTNEHPVATYYFPSPGVTHEMLDFKAPAGLSSVLLSFADKTANGGIACDPGIKNVRLKKLN